MNHHLRRRRRYDSRPILNSPEAWQLYFSGVAAGGAGVVASGGEVPAAAGVAGSLRSFFSVLMNFIVSGPSSSSIWSAFSISSSMSSPMFLHIWRSMATSSWVTPCSFSNSSSDWIIFAVLSGSIDGVPVVSLVKLPKFSLSCLRFSFTLGSRVSSCIAASYVSWNIACATCVLSFSASASSIFKNDCTSSSATRAPPSSAVSSSRRSTDAMHNAVKRR
mmetsp:Transcript_1670/g.4488  ORF Transcript_1670/g.4488 Transcript_1670/m.4488 type:complete len:219 (-) Transcript_1670:604-1260(-)